MYMQKKFFCSVDYYYYFVGDLWYFCRYIFKAMERITFSLLHQRLASIGFDEWDAFTEEDVYKGDPYCYAVFMRSIFCSFPHATVALLRKHQWLCIEGNPESLARSVLRLLVTECGHKNTLSPMQLKASKYALAKMNICIELFDFLSRSCSSTRGLYSTCKTKKKKLPEHLTFSRLASIDLSTALLKARLHELNKRKKALDHLARE